MSHFFESIFSIEQIIENPKFALSIIKEEQNSFLNKADTKRLCEEGFLLKAIQNLDVNSPEKTSYIIEILDSLDKEELAKGICLENAKNHNSFSTNNLFNTKQKAYNFIERVIEVGIIDAKILTTISQEKDFTKLSNYLDNALSYDYTQIKENNALYFLHSIQARDWETLKIKHPIMVEQFGQLKFEKNNSYSNILQEAAQFNPKLYQVIREDFPHISLSEYDRYFLQKINDPEIFIEEFKRDENHFKLNGKMFYLNQSRHLLDEQIKIKKVEEFDSYEIKSFGRFIITSFPQIFSDFINLPLAEKNELNKYQSIALEMLTLNDNDYIESFLYTIIQHPNQLIRLGNYVENMSGPINMLDKFDENFQKNKYIKKVSLRECLGDRAHENSEISLNTEFLGRLFQVKGLEIKEMTAINENPLAILWVSANYYLTEKKEKSVQKAIEALQVIQKFAIEQGHKYTFEVNLNSEDLDVTILDRTKSPNGGFLSRNITKAQEPNQILVTAALMNDFEFTNFMQKPLTFLTMLHNQKDKEIAQKIIIERAKDMGLLDCMADKHKEKNFFAILKIYSNEQLFQDGKLAMILQKTKSNLNDFIFSNESNNFIYDTINEDLSPYGFDYNNPQVLHSFIVNQGTSYLDLIAHKINNSTYRCPKTGDNSLHKFIKDSGNYQCIQEIVSLYPELASLTNKQGKFPINSAISKLKICKEGSDAFKNSASIIKQLITLDYGRNKDEIESLIQACEDISPKMNKVVPFWKQTLDEKVILAAVRNAITNSEENNETTDNEWKL